MPEALRYSEIEAALHRLGRPNVEVLLWTREARLASLVRSRVGVDVVRLQLNDGWFGWVLIRAGGPRRSCHPRPRRWNTRQPSTRSATASPDSPSTSSTPIVSAITLQMYSGFRCFRRRVARS